MLLLLVTELFGMPVLVKDFDYTDPLTAYPALYSQTLLARLSFSLIVVRKGCFEKVNFPVVARNSKLKFQGSDIADECPLIDELDNFLL